jgi:hypothetical protein
LVAVGLLANPREEDWLAVSRQIDSISNAEHHERRSGFEVERCVHWLRCPVSPTGPLENFRRSRRCPYMALSAQSEYQRSRRARKQTSFPLHVQITPYNCMLIKRTSKMSLLRAGSCSSPSHNIWPKVPNPRLSKFVFRARLAPTKLLRWIQEVWSIPISLRPGSEIRPWHPDPLIWKHPDRGLFVFSFNCDSPRWRLPFSFFRSICPATLGLGGDLPECAATKLGIYFVPTFSSAAMCVIDRCYYVNLPKSAWFGPCLLKH